MVRWTPLSLFLMFRLNEWLICRVFVSILSFGISRDIITSQLWSGHVLLSEMSNLWLGLLKWPVNCGSWATCWSYLWVHSTSQICHSKTQNIRWLGHRSGPWCSSPHLNELVTGDSHKVSFSVTRPSFKSLERPIWKVDSRVFSSFSLPPFKVVMHCHLSGHLLLWALFHALQALRTTAIWQLNLNRFSFLECLNWSIYTFNILH